MGDFEAAASLKPLVDLQSARYALIAGGLLLAAIVFVLMAPLNTDTAWMLVEARRLLSGERLYVDIMETNPPLIVWLSAVPAWLGAFGRWDDHRIAGLTIAVVVTTGSLVSQGVLSRPPASSRFFRLWLLATFLVSAVLLCAWDMGEREQIAAILTLPYALLAARAAMGERPATPLAVGCGAMAAIGFALKPFFLGAFAAIELAVLWSAGRSRAFSRIEPWTIAIFQVVYALVVMLAAPEYGRRIVPAMVATYGAYGNGIMAVVRTSRFWLPALVGTIAVAASMVSPWTFLSSCTRVFGAATLGWLLGYAIQGKGWQYHLIPVVVYGALALAATVVQVVSVLRSPLCRRLPARVGIVAAAFVLLLAGVRAAPAAWRLTLKEVGAIRGQDAGTVAALVEIVSQRAPGEPIYVLSTNMAPAFPVVNLAGARWPYHYHFLWPIPGLYRGATGTAIPYRAPAEQGELERGFFETVVSDLERIPPRLLIVDRSRDQQGMSYGRPFDFLRYFSSSPRFVGVMNRYRRVGAVGSYEVYERVG